MLKPSYPAPLLPSQNLWALLTFVGVLLALQLGAVDLRVADSIYRHWGSEWVWRDAWLTRDVIHEGGRKLVGVMIGVVLALFAACWLTPAGQAYRKGMAYLVVSTLCAALLINGLKELTHIECPWDLTRYGGSQPYVGLFDLPSWSSRGGACFPAGHASGGYAWFGLYYLALEYRPRWRWPVFGAVVLLGLVFGIGQLLRGAHFVSHDWWTAWLCWFVATSLHSRFFPKGSRVSHADTCRLLLKRIRPPRKPYGSVVTAVIVLLLPAPALADLSHDVRHLQQRWAEVNYQLEGHTQLSAFEQLTEDAGKVIRSNPESAEALIWSGIIKSTYADARGGFGALSLAKASKADLERALQMDPEAMQGSAYTSLGALYYSVPGWPLSFGDDTKAEAFLTKALTLDPDGIDANYFYADYLISEHHYTEARVYLLKAQPAAPRPGSALADSGRQREISAKLRELADDE